MTSTHQEAVCHSDTNPSHHSRPFVPHFLKMTVKKISIPRPSSCQKFYVYEGKLMFLAQIKGASFTRTQRNLTKSAPGKFKVLSRS